MIVQLAHLALVVREVETFCGLRACLFQRSTAGRIGRPRAVIAQTYARSLVARRLRKNFGYAKSAIAASMGVNVRAVRRWCSDL